MYDFEKHEQYFYQSHPHSHEISSGEGVVMVSAPHSVEQLRSAKIKKAEPQSGAIARLLHDEIGCPVIYKTAYMEDDANHDDVSPYREDLVEYCRSHSIKLVLDLHQLDQSRPMDVDVGTGKGAHIAEERYLQILLDNLSRYRLDYQLDIPFSASKPYTVSGHVHNALGITTMQIEINSRLVYEPLDPTSYERIYMALRDTILTINQEDNL